MNRILRTLTALSCALVSLASIAVASSKAPAWVQALPSAPADDQKALRQFHVDARAGDDGADGLSPQRAWKTIERANQHRWKAGDHLLFKRGQTFPGSLTIKGAMGSKKAYIRVGAYGAGETLPLIDGKGHPSAVAVISSRYVQVGDLEITNNHGQAKAVTRKVLELIHDKPRRNRPRPTPAVENVGVDITVRPEETTANIHLVRLQIHDIFPEKPWPSEGRIYETHHGYGVRISIPREKEGTLRDIVVEDCHIKDTGYFGILTRAKRTESRVENIVIRNCRTERTGGSGLLAAWLANAYVVNNTFDRSGDFSDARKHGRGSGSWTFAAQNVLYERNVFSNSKGKGDSAGVHVDFNCRNVIVQRNFSYNNEGGFMEVLGNNHNCAYRYNISVNDGSRIKGKDGARQEGKILFVSGHCMQAPYGPFNSYFYNNTIYVKRGIDPKFSITHSAKGLLIANNIFYLEGKGSAVAGDQPSAEKSRKHRGKRPQNVVFTNNMYPTADTLPDNLGTTDTNKIIANPSYRNSGGKHGRDYIPTNISAVQDKGIRITKLPGDDIGLEGGVAVTHDFFGNPIQGRPDLGAIEVQTTQR